MNSNVLPLFYLQSKQNIMNHVTFFEDHKSADIGVVWGISAIRVEQLSRYVINVLDTFSTTREVFQALEDFAETDMEARFIFFGVAMQMQQKFKK